MEKRGPWLSRAARFTVLHGKIRNKGCWAAGGFPPAVQHPLCRNLSSAAWLNTGWVPAGEKRGVGRRFHRRPTPRFSLLISLIVPDRPGEGLKPIVPSTQGW